MLRIALLAALLIPSIAAAQSKEDRFHCVGNTFDTTYVSAVFPCIPDDPERPCPDGRTRYFIHPTLSEWEEEFQKHLVEKHDDPFMSARVKCDAIRNMQLDRYLLQHKKNTVVTEWHPYEHLDEGIEEKPLRDFQVAVSQARGYVRGVGFLEVCVRDHECADGDRVTVAVNGENWFYDEEITNEWICESETVGAGQNSIELLAVNGTGFEGDCNFGNVNTGEIRVGGATGETQSWKHRGGAGSKANIIVTVR